MLVVRRVKHGDFIGLKMPHPLDLVFWKDRIEREQCVYVEKRRFFVPMSIRLKHFVLHRESIYLPKGQHEMVNIMLLSTALILSSALTPIM